MNQKTTFQQLSFFPKNNRKEQPGIITAKPILKWVGGKTQLLDKILPLIPRDYNRYIEPFLGGGAVFFATNPSKAIISDSNPELINLYIQVRDHVEEVIKLLKNFCNSSEMFYKVRSQNWEELTPTQAAARMIFLNKTCFNGLYRVNKKGEFNSPYGNYDNPKICDEEKLRAASKVLKNKKIYCEDFSKILDVYAQEGDFIFLDPPYIPVSKYSDFKRYTKEQFSDEEHKKLAKIVHTLNNKGCKFILTLSNTPEIYQLYSDFSIEIIETKRSISCKGNKRKGQDVIITNCNLDNSPKRNTSEKINGQINKYPSTRFMGSKSKLITDIYSNVSQFNFDTVLDLFSGSGIVSYMFKVMGKSVFSNDYMTMNSVIAKAMIENNTIKLSLKEAESLLEDHFDSDHFVTNNFQGLYFSDEDNKLIDILRQNISNIGNDYKKSIAQTALIRTCLKKRPRGIFTYTGFKYDDGRRDLKKSFSEHFLDAVNLINNAVFNNNKINVVTNVDSMILNGINPDLVYIDPPYYSPFSDNDYIRRYHFLEGLAKDWQGIEIQENTKTKKFKTYPTPFTTREGTFHAFDTLFKRYSKSIIIVSYSSNSLPTKEEIFNLLLRYKKNVEVKTINYRYNFGNQNNAKTKRNNVSEYLFLGF